MNRRFKINEYKSIILIVIQKELLLEFIKLLEDQTHKHLTIKTWAEDDRPREKLVTKGRQSLSDAELLAILLSSGNREETALQLAQRILNTNNNSINQFSFNLLQ